MSETILRCPLCHDTGRVRRLLGFGHSSWAQCPACPPSETVTEALERAAADRTTPKGEREP